MKSRLAYYKYNNYNLKQGVVDLGEISDERINLLTIKI